jgi:3-keto-5-aminohexanoate cleavage enzyme
MSVRRLDKKVIITVAPTGSWPTKKMNPNLPITPIEIAKEVKRSYDSGATIAHIHARDISTGEPTTDFSTYLKIIEQIKKYCPHIIINISTGSGAAKKNYNEEERILPVRKTRPEIASLNCGTMNMAENVFINSVNTIKKYARVMQENKVKPEFEVFDLSMINTVNNVLINNNLVRSPYMYSLVLGVEGGIPASIKNIVYMVDALPSNAIWQVIARGRNQIPLGTAGIIMGGNIRVGFEDNIYIKHGMLAQSNAQLVDKICDIIKELGYRVATVQDARDLLGL